MEPVLEVRCLEEFQSWPVRGGSSAVDFLVLSGAMTEDAVAAAMALLVSPYLDGEEEASGPPGAQDALHALITADAVVAAGGLRVRDTTTGVTVEPGCCCGLEDWRSWSGIARGEQVWLGHAPTPVAELHGEVVRLRQREDEPDGLIELACSLLPGLLTGVGRDLTGFIARAATWADGMCPGLGADVANALDDGFHVT